MENNFTNQFIKFLSTPIAMLDKNTIQQKKQEFLNKYIRKISQKIGLDYDNSCNYETILEMLQIRLPKQDSVQLWHDLLYFELSIIAHLQNSIISVQTEEYHDENNHHLLPYFTYEQNSNLKQSLVVNTSTSALQNYLWLHQNGFNLENKNKRK